MTLRSMMTMNPLAIFTPLALGAVLTTAVTAQVYLPAGNATNTNELNHYDDAPFMRTDSRVMQLYGRNEVGTSSLTARALSFRYDGPIPPVGAPGPFTIRRLRIAIGTTKARDTSAVFARNLSQPLTKVFDGRVSFYPDQSFSGPEAWGGPRNTLRFAFSAPQMLAVANDERLVLDIRVAGNSNNGRTHALVDGERGTGGPQDGTATSSGMGCAASANGNPATVLTAGIHAPGAAHSIYGKNLGANAAAVLFIGASDRSGPVGALPFRVPGTACSVYTSQEIMLPARTDATGSLAPFSPGTEIPVPPNPWLSNATIFEQIATIVPGANPWGVVFSDLRTVNLGQFNGYARSMTFLRQSDNADGTVADIVREFGLALRIE